MSLYDATAAPGTHAGGGRVSERHYRWCQCWMHKALTSVLATRVDLREFSQKLPDWWPWELGLRNISLSPPMVSKAVIYGTRGVKTWRNNFIWFWCYIMYCLPENGSFIFLFGGEMHRIDQFHRISSVLLDFVQKFSNLFEMYSSNSYNWNYRELTRRNVKVVTNSTSASHTVVMWHVITSRETQGKSKLENFKRRVEISKAQST
jgi:hypothetical protein